ncbi:MAG TPA: alkaline phosphatase family protein, partial [Thermoanaerobaculia bacterium]|nr:alkaline phosphatase family protein [Thermoanaerobaculia bacterium]
MVLALLLLSLFVVSGCSRESEAGRVIVLGIDGLDPHTLDLLISEGKMPNFAKMRQQGAYSPLLSAEPLLSPVIWTTIATGRPPTEHGIGHFTAVKAETGEQLPVTSQMRRVDALWNILSNQNREVAVVGWWATWPPEQVKGAIVSDHTMYHFLFEEGISGDADRSAKTFPPELQQEIEPLLTRPQSLGVDDLAPYIRITQADLDRPFAFTDDVQHFRWALAAAHSHRDVGLHLWNKLDPDTLMIYVEGVDSTSHLFGHLFRAEGLAGDLAAQQAKYGQAVEKMYLLADAIVGDYIEAMDDDTTLIVLSDHGFELGVLQDDPSKLQDMRRVSERFHRL